MRRVERLRAIPRRLGGLAGTRRDLVDEIDALRAELRGAGEEVRAVRAAMTALREDAAAERAAAEQARAETAGRLDHLFRVLQAIHDRGGDNRRRVAELRDSDDYRQAYDEREPLVSVIVPTYRNYGMLRDRALPSVLAQTYGNLEVVVVGDCAPPETAEAIAAIGDDRVRYFNLPVRGPYPDDPHELWLVSGSAPYNEALRRARGRWLAPFADDDALRPHAVETMLAHVRDEGLEGAYGVLNCVAPDREPFLVGEFPPREGGLGLQGALYHAGLRFFDQPLSQALFGIPNDWGMVRRMLHAGVRWGFLEEIVCDYFPTHRVPDPRSDQP